MEDKLVVFYDGDCPLCRNAKKAIERFDRRGSIEWLSFRREGVMETYDLYEKKPEERIHSIRMSDSQRFEGIYTLQQIAMRVPRYRPLVPLLHLTIKLGFGQRLYDSIAKRRKIVPVGQCGSEGCPVHLKPNDRDGE
ncbi:MAG TPA: DUF393 domain-containing protein [Bacillales bacterium]|nr:DUF393 domain-containing protein [Bacillales bacterium]